MALSTVTAIDALRLVLKDKTAAGGTDAFMSDAEYERFILGYCLKETTFQLQKLRSNYWTLPGWPSAVYGPSGSSTGLTTTITTGVLTCAVPDPSGGVVSFVATAGTDNSEQLALTACQLDFPACVEGLLMFIATHRAQEYTQAVHGNSVSPETASSVLRSQAELWRGVRAL